MRLTYCVRANAQLMLVLDYCHKLGVSSRDIKLENTLLEKAPGRRPMLKLCGKEWPGSGAPGSRHSGTGTSQHRVSNA